MKSSIYSVTTDELNKLYTSLGHKRNDKNISEVLNLIYRYPWKEFSFGTHIPKLFIKKLKQEYSWDKPKVRKALTAADKTTKFLIEYSPNKIVEAVLIPFRKSFSLCVSSQVGCAMNCSFCHTATQGLTGNLRAEEIIQQYILAKEFAKEDSRPIRNLVFMGQGEPLHNFENIKKTLNILTDTNGISLSAQKITLSTSGYLPGLKRFHELKGINLALSLHSVDMNIRSQLIPLNKRYPLPIIQEAINHIPLRPKQYVEYEYLLINKLNDSIQDAQNLAQYLKDKKAIVNLIPYNEFPGTLYQKSSLEVIKTFADILINNKIRTMIRTTKGDDILAACGQLKSQA